MRRLKTLTLASTLLALLLPAGAADDLTSSHYGSWGFDESGMDRSVTPGADFNAYANGGWLKNTAIPSELTAFGVLDQQFALSDARVHAILEDAAAGTLKDRDAVMIGALYRSFMDEQRTDQLDTQPLAPQLAAIRGIQNLRDAAALMGKQNSGYAFIFELSVSQDPRNPERHAVFVNAAGLGLPDRDYYLKDSFSAKKSAYQIYARTLLDMIGWDDPTGNAQAIVAFETRLAEASWTRAQLRDSDKTYHPVTITELKTLAPDFDWDAFLDASGLPKMNRAIVTSDTAFPRYTTILASTPLPALRAWFAFRLLDRYAMMLSRRFADAQFAFRGRQLGGQQEQVARWRLAVGLVNDVLGQSVGRVYVARYLPPAAKATIDAMVAQFRKAMEARIRKLDWMSDATKRRALDKLARISAKIGYPTKWRDYGTLDFHPTDLLGNRLKANAARWQRQISLLSRPVDHDEWNVLPQALNAYYFPVNNEMIFAAAALQRPFFDPDADAAVNYGGIGVSIGHEMSHAFDDHGRKFDGKGVLTDWWTPEDAERFNARAARLGAQYSTFEPLPGMHVNGTLTMGENIGDLGGLLLALDAYHASLKGKPAPVISGFTGDQRLFLSFAQVQRQKMRDEALRQRLVAAPHPPPQVRVNGTVRNVDAWYAAFDIKPGDPLYVAPQDRVRIW